MTIETFIPSGDIPKSRYAGQAPLRWLGMDSEENCRRHPHPEYGPEAIVYEFNSYGYRCPEFTERGDLTLLTIGCSWTFGLGLPRQDAYPELLGRRLAEATGRGVTVWNLGLSGRSNDYISRMLLCAVPVLAPDLVVVMFTALARREFVTADGRLLNVMPRYHGRRADPVAEEVFRYHGKLASDHQDAVNFLKNYKLVDLLLAGRGTPRLYTAVSRDHRGRFAYALDPARFLDFGIPCVDVARDNHHPGRRSHQAFVERLLPIATAQLAV